MKLRKSFNRHLFSRSMTSENRGLQGVTKGYKGLQGVTRGYKGLQLVMSTCFSLLVACGQMQASICLHRRYQKTVEVREKEGFGPGERKRDYKNPLSFVCQISYWVSHIE